MREVYRIVSNNARLDNTKRLISVTLRVGEMRDLVGHLVQTYWNYITKGTNAEGSIIKLSVIPTTCKCNKCGYVYAVKIMEMDVLCCPACRFDKATLLTGNEMSIEEVEVKTITSGCKAK